MKKRTRIAALILCFILALSLCGLPALAADNDVIDGESGTLTLYKYQNAAGAASVVDSADKVPVEGATFSAYRVIDLTATQGNVTVAVNDAFKGVITNVTYNNGKFTYTNQAGEVTNNLEDWLDDLTGAAENATYEAITDVEGKAAFGSMDLGVYLVVETGAPGNYYATTGAFLVSVPTTEKNADGDSYWEYDVVAYPKNDVIEVDKLIVGGGAHDQDTKADSYSIGDTVTFRLSSDIPRYADEVYQSEDVRAFKDGYTADYYFRDEMTAGLTYVKNSVLVMVGDQTLVRDQDYKLFILDRDGDWAPEATWSEDLCAGRTLKVQLLPAAIAAYAGQEITVTYETALNADAALTAGDTNTVKVLFTSSPQQNSQVPQYSETEGRTVRVYTYAFTLAKQFSANGGNFADVTFELKDANGVMKCIKNGSGSFTICASEKEAPKAIPSTGLDLDVDGRLAIKGLESGVYTLTELTTTKGFNLLPKPITISIYETYTKEGADPIYRLDKDYFKLIDGKMVKQELTKLDAGYAMVGTVAHTADEDTGAFDTGRFTFNVMNTKGFDLPHTGGMGTWIFTIGGLFLMAAAVVLLAKAGKRKTV